jgi:hypothetical protein
MKNMYSFLVLLALMFIMLNTNDLRSLKVKEQRIAQLPQTEICQVIEREQTIHSPRGDIRVAIVRRSNGELRDICLDTLPNHTQPAVAKIPSEVEYIYATGLNIHEMDPSSVVLIYPPK